MTGIGTDSDADDNNDYLVEFYNVLTIKVISV
jgi:hypothetical protein